MIQYWSEDTAAHTCTTLRLKEEWDGDHRAVVSMYHYGSGTTGKSYGWQCALATTLESEDDATLPLSYERTTHRRPTQNQSITSA
ncbi:hypothetical protein GCM10009066_21020 [Halarchaeum salinum]|uniref:Uncharacterized protein n=1 Tax=Halarchaeum salinum TaxID=489912 RepID=A0AAV3SA46_9EURY